MAKRKSTEDAPLAVGDTCYLNSGSPRMTVIGLDQLVDGTVSVFVAWVRYDTGEMHRDRLPAASLRKDWK